VLFELMFLWNFCSPDCFVQNGSKHSVFVENAEESIARELMENRQVKKELIDKLLEVSRQAAREVESAVSAVKDPHVRGVIAGVIMQRILDGGHQ
jgi:DNA anti-recombination protein RmuC